MKTKYRLTADYQQGNEVDLAKGEVLYTCDYPDYGSASIDSFINQRTYMSMTLDGEGNYPFFTVPADIMEAI